MLWLLKSAPPKKNKTKKKTPKNRGSTININMPLGLAEVVSYVKPLLHHYPRKKVIVAEWGFHNGAWWIAFSKLT